MRSIRRLSKYGWKPDLPDYRDKRYKFIAPVELPRLVDMRNQCSPVENQGNLGSCTANALVGNLEFLEIKEGVDFSDLSRLFVYYNERTLEGHPNEDSGAQLRDGIKVLNKQGVCKEYSWPYDISQFAVKPTTDCYQEALSRVITSYERLNTIQEMKDCLASGYPFVFGFTVFESFESNIVARTGIVSMPNSDESPIGGHAVLAVGYDDDAQMFIVRNSWGANWGQQGYFKMPYDYVKQLADDFWVIRK